MKLTAAIFILVLVDSHTHLVTGQVPPMFRYDAPDDYEDYYSSFSTTYKDKDKDYDERIAKLRKLKEQRFTDALIMEAGRHVLYPFEERPVLQLDNTPTPEYDDIKGQPEYVDLGISRSIRRSEIASNRQCPQECLIYEPVCGNDGTVYDSHCEMLRLNCGKANVSVVDWELCRGKHFLCPSRCLNINDPVCGDDGRLYRNSCVMRRRNCGVLMETKPIKYCYVKDRESKVYGPCPEDCQEIYNPVCGSDGVTYYNECFLQMWTCGENVKVLDKKECAQMSECPERCVSIYDPVCGSDGKLYLNYCKLLLENCGSNISRMPKSYCRQTSKKNSPIRIVKKSNV